MAATASCDVARRSNCRLWGVVRALPCPWGCKPERYLTPKEGFQLLAECEARSREICEKAK